MSSEENHEQQHELIERRMAFIVEQQSKFLTDIDRLRERQDQTSKDIEQLKESQVRTSDSLERLVGVVSELAQTVEAQRDEIRDAISNLIVANEATRELASQAARLAISASQRITRLESERQ